jgi:hypothetical protein
MIGSADAGRISRMFFKGEEKIFYHSLKKRYVLPIFRGVHKITGMNKVILTVAIAIFCNLETMAMSQETLPAFSELAKSIEVGSMYEHYKGMRYKILGVGRHSETLEELVVYQALYGDGDIWVRPLGMFLEEIVIKGQSRPRFTRVQ